MHQKKAPGGEVSIFCFPEEGSGWVALISNEARVNAGARTVRVEEVGLELRYRRLGGVVAGKLEGQRVKAALPVGAFLPGDSALPHEQVHRSVRGRVGLGHESERMVLPPELALLRKPRLGCHIIR